MIKAIKLRLISPDYHLGLDVIDYSYLKHDKSVTVTMLISYWKTIKLPKTDWTAIMKNDTIIIIEFTKFDEIREGDKSIIL